MTLEQIINNLNARQFSPVYLLMGEEPFYIDQISEMIADTAVEESQRDFNQVILYGKETTANEVFALAKEIPFGSDKRVIIIKEAKDLKNIDILLQYALAPSLHTILVICYKYGKLKANQYKGVEKVGTIFLSEKIKDYNLSKWVLDRAGYYHFKMLSPTANLIAEHIGNDLSRIDNEFKKLRIFLTDNSTITSDVVEKYIGISKEYNIIELEEALVQRNLPKVYKITLNFCQHLHDNPNIKTIFVLYTYYSKMLAYHLSDQSPQSRAAIFGNLPPFIMEKNCTNAKNHSIYELKHIISLLREYDAKAKGVDADLKDEELLKELIYKLTH